MSLTHTLTNIVYSFPIWFKTKSIELKVPDQGLMLYVPYPSIVFSTQSITSFITPEWKAAYDVVKYLQAFLWTGILTAEYGASRCICRRWISSREPLEIKRNAIQKSTTA